LWCEVSNYVAAMVNGLARLRGGFPSAQAHPRDPRHPGRRPRGADKTPGEFRRGQNWVGGTRPGDGPPPNVSDLMSVLDNFEKFLHDHLRAHLLIKAALAHAQFETIHPLDGNGRVGRLLMTFLLCAGALQQPLLTSLYLKQNRAAYYDSLQKVRVDGDWEQWIEFSAGVVGGRVGRCDDAEVTRAGRGSPQNRGRAGARKAPGASRSRCPQDARR
jgi:Fic family protein